jgi:hypothetical protein
LSSPCHCAYTVCTATVLRAADCDDAIRAAHIFAALALVDYADHDVTYLFGDRVGDPTADTIVDALRRRGRLTRNRSERYVWAPLSLLSLSRNIRSHPASGCGGRTVVVARAADNLKCARSAPVSQSRRRESSW